MKELSSQKIFQMGFKAGSRKVKKKRKVRKVQIDKTCFALLRINLCVLCVKFSFYSLYNQYQTTTFL